MAVLTNILIVGCVIGVLYYMNKEGIIKLPSLGTGDDMMFPAWQNDTTNESDQASVLSVSYPDYHNPARSPEQAITDGSVTDESDDNAYLSRPGDALPAPIDSIALDAQPLARIYGTAFIDAQRSTAAAAATAQYAQMPLPMVADTKSAAPLKSLGSAYNVSAASPDMMKSTCRAACADRKTQALVDGCVASCQNKSLGIEVHSYDNAVDLLRPILPPIPSSGSMTSINF